MSIEPRDLTELGELARLELTAEELRSLARDCQAILAYFDDIRELDLSGVEESGGPAAEAPLREDVERPDPLERPPESFAPEWKDGFFLLPRLSALDDGSGEGPEG